MGRSERVVVEEDASTHGLLVVCRLGERLCGIPIQHVAETMRPLPIEPLSDLPEFVLGLSIVRSAPTPVVDLGKLVAGATAQGDFGRFVTVKTGPRPLALAVSEVLGVHAPPDSLAKLPPLLQPGDRELVSAVGKLHDRLLFVLESSRLVPPEVWESIARRELRS